MISWDDLITKVLLLKVKSIIGIGLGALVMGINISNYGKSQYISGATDFGKELLDIIESNDYQ